VKRTKIKQLHATPPLGQSVTVKGWLKTRRGGKKFSFAELNDGSTIKNLQVVLDHSRFDDDTLKALTTGACVGFTGTVVESTGQGQAIEMHADVVEIYGPADPETYPLQKKAHSLEFMREIAHLRPRSTTFGCILRLRHAMAYGIHHFFHNKGFFYVHSPIITASDCEGAGEMFTVTTLDLSTPPKDATGAVDFGADFFGRPAHLTVSGQLNAELAALALSEVYTFGPTFRAENSNTTRHLAEFWMIEPEMAFYDLTDNMALAEELLQYLVRYALEEHFDDIDFLAATYDETLIPRLRSVVESPFERCEYTRAVEILQASGRDFEFPVRWGMDLQSEHERYLVEQHFQKPVIVYHYPKDIKAFYMRQNDDGKTVAAMDVLFPKVGEIIGGSQREERHDKLLQRIREMGLPEANYWWYLDTRKFGTAPHSGFGLGFERFLTFLTGMGNIRDVIPFPRTPGNAEF
jgi:asparaginyl-tRNA synthetase